MMTRKQMKTNAKKVLKRHYFLFLLLCMVPAILGGELISQSSVSENGEEEAAKTQVTFTDAILTSFVGYTYDMIEGNQEQSEKRFRETEKKYVEQSQKEKNQVLGRRRGVLAYFVNKVSSRAYLITLAVGLRSIVKSDSGVIVLFLVIILVLMLIRQILVVGVYRTITARMFLEGRNYEKVPVHRVWFLLKLKKWCHVGIVHFVTGIYTFFWDLTIVGGIIKYYSYFLVPYIMAENPSIGTKDAIKLSRDLMNGHKWECFVLECSFIGWDLLGVVTLGLSDLFFNKPYKAAVMAEYYTQLRQLGKEKKILNSELLNDEYLFAKAEPSLLSKTYEDVATEYRKMDEEVPKLKGLNRFFADVFGVILYQNQETERIEKEQSQRFQMQYEKMALEGSTYPARLSPIPEKQKRKLVASLNYLRSYSVWSIILMFFSLAFVGWLWEVSLHLIVDGQFVNRGVMHGPWLPIYGCGGVVILLLLNKFRKKPGLEFLMAIILCGCIEYFSSVYLEMTHDGMKWWDYSGYFLNLNGRICAEGLLIFGIAVWPLYMYWLRF